MGQPGIPARKKARPAVFVVFCFSVLYFSAVGIAYSQVRSSGWTLAALAGPTPLQSLDTSSIKDVLEKQAGNDTYTPWQNSKVREADNKWSHTLLPENLSIATVEFKLGFTLLRSAFPGQTKMPTLIFDAGRLFSQARHRLLRPPRDAHGRGLYREILRAFIAATSEGALVNSTEKL
jgi:hypothetical protein